MVALPPGTILQLMYLRERIASLPAGRFIEIGPGAGEISSLLLQRGWHGDSYDLNPHVVESLKARFKDEIECGRYNSYCKDYLREPILDNVDLVISSLVLEHFDSNSEALFIRKSLEELSPTGRIICFVPGSPAHWGIEDDIAGHYRRYTRDTIMGLFDGTLGRVEHVAGLTYPLSNLLLPISNYLVKAGESWKLAIPSQEQTTLSGNRNVPLKTSFPDIARWILNDKVMWPLHIIQKAFSRSNKAMILYFEASRLSEEHSNERS